MTPGPRILFFSVPPSNSLVSAFGPLKGFIEQTRRPSRALDSLCALLPELQRIKDTDRLPPPPLRPPVDNNVKMRIPAGCCDEAVLSWMLPFVCCVGVSPCLPAKPPELDLPDLVSAGVELWLDRLEPLLLTHSRFCAYPVQYVLAK